MFFSEELAFRQEGSSKINGNIINKNNPAVLRDHKKLGMTEETVFSGCVILFAKNDNPYNFQ